MVVFFKQKTAYEMRISDWSSDVCSSDLDNVAAATPGVGQGADRVPSGSFAPASWREQKVPFPHYIAEACHQRLPPATCLPCVAERRPFGQAHSPGSRRRSR